MRIVKEIPNPSCKITVFSWNDKYLIKFEKGNLEQTYKVNEWDILKEDDLEKLIGGALVEKVNQRFDDMMIDFNAAMQSID